MVVRNPPERRGSTSLKQTHGRAGASDLARKLSLYTTFFFLQKIDFIELAIFDTSQRAVGHFTPALNLNLCTNWIQVITYDLALIFKI